MTQPRSAKSDPKGETIIVVNVRAVLLVLWSLLTVALVVGWLVTAERFLAELLNAEVIDPRVVAFDLRHMFTVFGWRGLSCLPIFTLVWCTLCFLRFVTNRRGPFPAMQVALFGLIVTLSCAGHGLAQYVALDQGVLRAVFLSSGNSSWGFLGSATLTFEPSTLPPLPEEVYSFVELNDDSAPAVVPLVERAEHEHPEASSSWLPFAIGPELQWGKTVRRIGIFGRGPLAGRVIQRVSLTRECRFDPEGRCSSRAVYYIARKPSWQYRVGAIVSQWFGSTLASSGGFVSLCLASVCLLCSMTIVTGRRILDSIAAARAFRSKEEHHPIVGDAIIYFVLGRENGSAFVDSTASLFEQAYGFNGARARRRYVWDAIKVLPVLALHQMEAQVSAWAWLRWVIPRR